MKKLIYLILFLIICANFVFSQTSAKQNAQILERKKLELKREKFDPNRDPHQDLQAAIDKAAKENKRIILDVGGEWCGWCWAMDFYFMRNRKLEKLRDKNFIWVKVNMSEENENKDFLAKYPEIKTYPHLFILEKDGSLLLSQDTTFLEEPDLPIIVPSKVKNKEKFLEKEYEKRNKESYNLKRFTNFLKKWSPAK